MNNHYQNHQNPLYLHIILLQWLRHQQGCATLARIEPIKGVGQVLEFRQGRAILVSGGRHSAVGILPELAQYQIGPRLSFRLRVENYGSEVIDFSESNISASINGQALQIVPMSQLANEISEEAKWARVSAILSGVAGQMNAANSGHTTYSGTSTTSIYGTGGNAYGTGTYSGTIYDPGKAQLAQEQAVQQTNQQLSSIDMEEQLKLELAQRGIIQRTTIHQGEAVQGHVFVQLPKDRIGNNSIVLRVSVGDDVHHLSFTESQLQQ